MVVINQGVKIIAPPHARPVERNAQPPAGWNLRGRPDSWRGVEASAPTLRGAPALGKVAISFNLLANVPIHSDPSVGIQR